MNNLISLLREAGSVQVIDWDIFKNYKKNGFFLNTPTNSNVTEVFSKFDTVVVRYTFDVNGKLIAMSDETPKG